MRGINAIVGGTLSNDAEQRTSAGGKPFAKASIALRDGDVTTWVRLVAFGELADELATLRKGDAMAATGRLKASAYLTKSGEPAASLELVVDRLLPLQAPPPRPRREAVPAPAPAPPREGPLRDWDNDL